MPYLTNLAVRLAAGAAEWPETFRRRHADYLRVAQRGDGGFAGRRGDSDLYYTSLALRGLIVLDSLDTRVAARAGVFLESRLDRTLTSVELLSLVFSAALIQAAGRQVLTAHRTAALVAAIDRYRRPDGGFAKTLDGPTSSTYHTFLAVLCRQMLGAPTVPAGPLVKMICSRRREDGGFVEIPQMRASGTNPTAAAVTLLAELDGLDDPTRDGAARFLASMQNDGGGFRANTQIPVADLLSTLPRWLRWLNSTASRSSTDPPLPATPKASNAQPAASAEAYGTAKPTSNTPSTA
jgi:geranylgeranyl transferase type-2 subunit beta